jgi:hypothetical protein
MSTPRTRPLKRFGTEPPELRLTLPDGHYTSGLTRSDYAEAIGHLAASWPHVEEAVMRVLASLLGDTHTAPARQVFRSIVSERARIDVMRAILEKGEWNRKRDQWYDTSSTNSTL